MSIVQSLHGVTNFASELAGASLHWRPSAISAPCPCVGVVKRRASIHVAKTEVFWVSCWSFSRPREVIVVIINVSAETLDVVDKNLLILALMLSKKHVSSFDLPKGHRPLGGSSDPK